MTSSSRRRTSSAPSEVRRGLRVTAAMLLSLALLGGGACGFDVQTNRPYNPAEGVNYDVGDPPVSVRNLMVLSREDGVGFINGTLTAAQNDSLTSVSGQPVKPDSAPGAPFQVSGGLPVPLPNGAIVVLTNRPLITVSSDDLLVGGEAELTLTFATAGTLNTRVPVVDANEPPYATITPSAAATPAE